MRFTNRRPTFLLLLRVTIKSNKEKRAILNKNNQVIKGVFL